MKISLENDFKKRVEALRNILKKTDNTVDTIFRVQKLQGLQHLQYSETDGRSGDTPEADSLSNSYVTQLYGHEDLAMVIATISELVR